MLSVIVCSNLPRSWTAHEDHIRDTVGCDYEYIRLNQEKFKAVAAAYNEGVRLAKGDILVFMHEDTNISENWGLRLSPIFKDETVGAVGISGSQCMFADDYNWMSSNSYMRGAVTYPRACLMGVIGLNIPDNEDFITIQYSNVTSNVNVIILDGIFMAIRRSLFENIHWDDRIFDGSYFYDLDICMQIGKTHRSVVTSDISLTHYSQYYNKSHQNMREWGTIDRYGKLFLSKWKDDLPIKVV